MNNFASYLEKAAQKSAESSTGTATAGNDLARTDSQVYSASTYRNETRTNARHSDNFF